MQVCSENGIPYGSLLSQERGLKFRIKSKRNKIIKSLLSQERGLK